MNPTPELHFEAAPPARRIQIVFILVIVIMVGVDVFIASRLLGQGKVGQWPGLLALLPAWFLLLGIWWDARIKEYVISDGAVVVVRAFRSKKFALAELQQVSRYEKTQRFVKLWGNDGLGAVSGTFRSKDLGTFKIFASDPGQLVLLRWKHGQIVALSPDKTQPFIEAVRRAAR